MSHQDWSSLGTGVEEDVTVTYGSPELLPESAASFIAAMRSARRSSACRVSSRLGQQEELSLMVEGVTPMKVCVHVMLQHRFKRFVLLQD